MVLPQYESMRKHWLFYFSWILWIMNYVLSSCYQHHIFEVILLYSLYMNPFSLQNPRNSLLGPGPLETLPWKVSLFLLDFFSLLVSPKQQIDEATYRTWGQSLPDIHPIVVNKQNIFLKNYIKKNDSKRTKKESSCSSPRVCSTLRQEAKRS